MIRTQVQLTEAQAHKLKEVAQQQGISISELIRQAVDRKLEETNDEEKWRRASSLIGKYSGGPSDVSTRHDDYLAEDFL